MATLKNTSINDTGYIKPAAGTTAQRPGTPSAGMIRWNTTDTKMEVYDGTEWKVLSMSTIDIIQDGLVVYLDANDSNSYGGSGTTWVDLKGNYNATLVNGPTYVTSPKSIDLDGTNDYITLGTFFNYTTFTISLWVKPDSSQVQYADIFDNNHTGTQNFVCQQNSTNLNQYEFAVIGSSTVSTTGLFTLTSNEWCCLTFTFDGNVTRGYKNGIIIGTGNSTTPNYVSPNLRIGGWHAGGRNWNGAYGNFLIYNKKLTDQEVLQNYNSTKARFET